MKVLTRDLHIKLKYAMNTTVCFLWIKRHKQLELSCVKRSYYYCKFTSPFYVQFDEKTLVFSFPLFSGL